MRYLVCLILIVIGSLLICTPSLGAIINGSFENSPLGIQPNGVDLGGWVVDGEAMITTYQLPADDGSRAAVLNVTTAGNVTGGVYQVFDTLPNKLYWLSFRMSGNFWRAQGNQILQLFLNDSPAGRFGYYIDTAPTTDPPTSMRWDFHEISFMSLSSTTKVEFLTEDDTMYPMIDNVVVATCMNPEPSTVLLLLLSLLFLHRRER